MYATERQTSDAHHRLMPPGQGHNKCVKVFSCYDVSSHAKYVHYTTLYVCLAHSHLDRVFDSALCPVGMVIRPWSFKPKQEKNADNSSEQS